MGHVMEPLELGPGNFKDKRIIGKIEEDTIHKITEYYYNKSKNSKSFSKRRMFKKKHSRMMCEFTRELTGFNTGSDGDIPFNKLTHLVIRR